MAESWADLYAGNETDSGNAGTDKGSKGDTPQAEPKSATEALDRATAEYDKAQDALKKGDLAEYQKRIDAMNDAIKDAKAAIDKAKK